MKTDKELSLDQRPWAPGCFITVTGLVLSRTHVRDVLRLERAKAVAATTAIIERIMKP